MVEFWRVRVNATLKNQASAFLCVEKSIFGPVKPAGQHPFK
jgi:hypothetical protein